MIRKETVLIILVGSNSETPSSKSGGAQAIENHRKQQNGADIIQFSGCRDEQTSADTFVKGLGATGAMSYAFVEILTKNPKQTYQQLLSAMRDLLASTKKTQVPQMSSNHAMDMKTEFHM